MRLEGGDGASDVLQKHLAYEQALNAESPLVLGNKLTLLQNGPATYQAMFATIREAKDHINLETFLHNDEINAMILGRGFAAQMEAMFAEDLRESEAITLDQWQHRSWMLRLKERMSRLGAYWL